MYAQETARKGYGALEDSAVAMGSFASATVTVRVSAMITAKMEGGGDEESGERAMHDVSGAHVTESALPFY